MMSAMNKIEVSVQVSRDLLEKLMAQRVADIIKEELAKSIAEELDADSDELINGASPLQPNGLALPR